MTSITLQIPQSGQPNSTEDPKVASNFTALQALLSGNVDGNTNIKTPAGSGLLSARPAASSGAIGALYYATDAGFLYYSTGSAWITVSSPTAAGGWQLLTLNTNIITNPGAYAPAARINGDRIEMRGQMLLNLSVTNGSTIFTVPVSCRPANAVILSTLNDRNSLAVASLPYPIKIPTTGVAIAASGSDGDLATNAVVSLDGLAYSLS